MLARQEGSRRRGAAAIWALLTLTTMLMALALALNAGWLATARQELGAATDAAALAGANGLVNDAWLRQEKSGVAALLQEARGTSREYAARNRVLGRPLALEPGDVVLGSYDPATPGTLLAADLSDPARLTLDAVNAVAVTGTRASSRGTGVPMLLGPLVMRPSVDMRFSSLAYLDRDVIGFRARPSNPIPLVPIGVRSDPTGADPVSWENQIVARNGPDGYQDTPYTAQAIPAPDQIPEIVLELRLDPNADPSQSNATLLAIGGAAFRQAQVLGGVTDEHLFATGGRLALGPNDTLTLPVGAADVGDLVSGLKQMRDSGVPRVWPLVAGIQGSQATVNAFVAARVVQVEAAGGGPLRVRLQPAMMAVPQAITDYSRRNTAHMLPSQYLAKPRLAR